MIDLSKVKKSDENGDSHFIAGGRAYFEAEASGYHVDSFTTRGFMDQLNYIEPIATNSDEVNLWLAVGIPVALIVIGFITLICYCRHKKAKEIDEMKRDHND